MHPFVVDFRVWGGGGGGEREREKLKKKPLFPFRYFVIISAQKLLIGLKCSRNNQLCHINACDKQTLSIWNIEF